jgi:hypothetical protein
MNDKLKWTPFKPRQMHYIFLELQQLLPVLHWPTNVLIAALSEGSKICDSPNLVKVDKKVINGMIFYGLTQPLICRPHNPGRCTPLFV